MRTKLGRTTLFVKDYDEALSFYQRIFFCHRIFDEYDSDGQRHLHIGFSDDQNNGLWLIKKDLSENYPTTDEPVLVVYTDNCKNMFQHLKENGVSIVSNIERTQDSKYFHCLDLYGHRIIVAEVIS